MNNPAVSTFLVNFVAFPPEPLSREHRDYLFAGDRSALRDIARLATHPAAGLAPAASVGEPLAASAPRRPSAERHLQQTTKQEPVNHARKSA